jgi:hypothetical protein
MEFMLVFTAAPGGATPTAADMEEMGKYAREVTARKLLERGFPLAGDAEAATVRVRDGRAFVSDGPFAESKEAIGGLWIVDVADREAALEIAARAPHVRHGNVEVHRIEGRYVFDDSEKGTPFLMVFRMEPGLRPEPEKLREMLAFGEQLVSRGALLETAHLVNAEPPKVLRVRDGKLFTTDGPFAESKEAVGGYAIVRVDGGVASAIAQAKQWPHARWGPVEVREILFFDRV